MTSALGNNSVMTFSLGTLSAEGTYTRSRAAATAPQAPPASLRGRVFLVLGTVLWLLLALALWTHDARDPGFSTSCDGER